MDILKQIAEWLSSKSLQIREWSQALLLLALSFEWINWTESQQHNVLLFLGVTLGLIVSKNTVASTQVAERNANAYNAGVQSEKNSEPTMTSQNAADATEGFRKPLAVLFLLITVSMTVACGNKLPPNTSIEARLSLRATQIVDGMTATLPTIERLTCEKGQIPTQPIPNCMSVDDALDVIAKMRTANDVAKELHSALVAVDQTPVDQREGPLKIARTLIAKFQAALSAVEISPDHESMRSRVVEVLTAVSLLLVTLNL